MSTGKTQWVATETFIGYDDEGEVLREAGRIYPFRLKAKCGEMWRPLRPGEPEEACPACGERFVAVDGQTLAECLNWHVNGDPDAESPSICVGVEYLRKLPARVPDSKALVHNHIRPTRRLGMRGFRAWLTRRDAERIEPCGCGFAPELGEHFSVILDRTDAPDRMDATA